MPQDIATYLYEPLLGSMSGVSLIALLLLISGIGLVYRTVRDARIVAIAAESTSMRVICGNCHWAGVVSTWAPRCPSCGAALDRGKFTASPPSV